MNDAATRWRALLPGRPPGEWLTNAQSLVLGGNTNEARTLLDAGHAAYPQDPGLALALAGLYLDAHRHGDAEELLNGVLAAQPTHLGAAFMLARVLRAQGKLTRMGEQLVAALSLNPSDPALAIRGIELLDDADRKVEAYALCQRALGASAIVDPRLHAYAGMLALQLGEFAQARSHYEAVLEQAGEPMAWEWHVAGGLSQLQRYADPADPDTQRFQHALRRTDISPVARTELLFALGKARDDLDESAAAAKAWREANALAHTRSRWSRKAWRRMVGARALAAPLPLRQLKPRGWAPLFVVGVPRSGTTLLAQRLATVAGVVQRGELRWLPDLVAQLPLQAPPVHDQLDRLAHSYERQLQQDDRSARWFIDKQPLNLLYVDLILALWPDARILYCARNSRDTALSLWAQSFGDPAHDYAYDFHDIAAVIQGCARLMRHWMARYPASIRMVSYETLVATPDAEIAALATWLDARVGTGAAMQPVTGAISTASLWQARQPIYQSSIERWRTYAPFVPELLRFDG